MSDHQPPQSRHAYLIEDPDRDPPGVYTIAFDTSRAAHRWLQRFGKPWWRVLPVDLLDLAAVEDIERDEELGEAAAERAGAALRLVESRA